MLQLVIEASDQGVPEKTVSLTVYIEVLRSTRAPTFDDTPYEVQRITETKKVGENVFKVQAHDPDLRVSLVFHIFLRASLSL